MTPTVTISLYDYNEMKSALDSFYSMSDNNVVVYQGTTALDCKKYYNIITKDKVIKSLIDEINHLKLERDKLIAEKIKKQNTKKWYQL